MPVQHAAYLVKAHGALSRRDYLTALQLGLRAAYAPRGQEVLRCEAHLLLALTSLELGAPEEALAYAVGAHLSACRLGDAAKEAQAAELVGFIVAAHQYLAARLNAAAVH